VIADLHGPELFYAVLPYLIGFTDGDVVVGHKTYSNARYEIFTSGNAAIRLSRALIVCCPHWFVIASVLPLKWISSRHEGSQLELGSGR